MSKTKQNLRRVDAPIYNYWQALYLSFFSRHLYLDVFKRWKGYGVLYLLLVVALATIPLSVRVIYYFDHYFDEQMMVPLKKIPPLHIQNGEVTFDKHMPYLIKNSGGSIVAIIDTTGKVKEINDSYPDLSILITKDKLYFRPPRFQLFFVEAGELKGERVYAQSLNKKSNEVFVGKEWVESSGIVKLKWTAEALVYPLMIGFIFGLYLMAMFFLIFIGQLFTIIIFKVKMTLKELCRLFFVAATPQTFLLFLLMSLNVVIPFAGIVYVILISIYFSYAVLVIKRDSKKLVRR